MRLLKNAGCIAGLCLASGLIALPAASAAAAETGRDRFAAPVDTIRKDALDAADRHADAATLNDAASIERLARYLRTAGADDLNRARALFRWTATQIEFDLPAAISGRTGDQRAETVLKQRKGASEGFANLVSELGTAMGLQARVITGWSKGQRYTAGDSFDGPPNHAWNAVRIDGQWRLMDTVWGSGYLDTDYRYNRQFQDHYFLTDPEIFLVDHLPENPRWQLVQPPLSLEDYISQAYTRPDFWRLGLTVISPQQVRISTRDRTRILLGTRQPVTLTARLLRARDGAWLQGEYALVQYGANEARIDVAAPVKGDFIVRIFARSTERDGLLDWVMDYRMAVSKGTPDAEFPKTTGAFARNRVQLLEPLSGTLRMGEIYRFRVQVPDALNVQVVTNGVWQPLKRMAGEIWQGDLDAGQGDIRIMASYSDNEKYTGLVKYVGK